MYQILINTSIYKSKAIIYELFIYEVVGELPTKILTFEQNSLSMIFSHYKQVFQNYPTFSQVCPKVRLFLVIKTSLTIKTAFS